MRPQNHASPERLVLGELTQSFFKITYIGQARFPNAISGAHKVFNEVVDRDGNGTLGGDILESGSPNNPGLRWSDNRMQGKPGKFKNIDNFPFRPWNRPRFFDPRITPHLRETGGEFKKVFFLEITSHSPLRGLRNFNIREGPQWFSTRWLV